MIPSDVAQQHLARAQNGLAELAGRTDEPAVNRRVQLAAQIAELNKHIASPPTVEEEAEALYAEQKRQLQVQAEAQARLIADEDVNTDQLELELHAIAKAAEELRTIDTSKADGGHDQ